MDNYRVRGVGWSTVVFLHQSVSSSPTRKTLQLENLSNPSLACLVRFIQVLIYSGQLDVIVAAPLTERFLPTVNWTGAAEYKTTPRFHWKVQPSDSEVAGYLRQVGEFYQVGKYEQQSKECVKSHVSACFVFLVFFAFRNLISCHAGHHPRRGTHFALWPTSEVLWHDWQIPFNTGLDMKCLGADQTTSTLESTLLINDCWL